MNQNQEGMDCKHKPQESIWKAARIIWKDKNLFTCKYCGKKIRIRKMKNKLTWVVLFAILNPAGYTFYFFEKNKALVLGILIAIISILVFLFLIFKCSKYEEI